MHLAHSTTANLTTSRFADPCGGSNVAVHQPHILRERCPICIIEISCAKGVTCISPSETCVPIYECLTSHKTPDTASRSLVLSFTVSCRSHGSRGPLDTSRSAQVGAPHKMLCTQSARSMFCLTKHLGGILVRVIAVVIQIVCEEDVNVVNPCF